MCDIGLPLPIRRAAVGSRLPVDPAGVQCLAQRHWSICHISYLVQVPLVWKDVHTWILLVLPHKSVDSRANGILAVLPGIRPSGNFIHQVAIDIKFEKVRIGFGENIPPEAQRPGSGDRGLNPCRLAARYSTTDGHMRAVKSAGR